MMASDEGLPCSHNPPEAKARGKVYQNIEIAGESFIRDSEWAANQYLAGIGLLAEAASKVREAKEIFSLAQSVTEDNGDPTCDAEDALVKLAEAMGSAQDYRKEYLAEIPDEA